MEVHLYGVRGSVASPLSASDVEAKFLKLLERAAPEDLKDSSSRRGFLEKQPLSLKGTYGSNTTCTILKSGDSWLIIDLGTGVRRFGHECVMNKRVFPEENPLSILVTHVHWDHIQGFPFFAPAYIPGNHVNFYSARTGFQKQFLRQQESPWCPAHYEFMKANINFNEVGVSDVMNFGPWKVSSLKVHHPDENLGYRIEADGGVFVFLSDTEITGLRPSEIRPYQEFCRGADCVYVDCQYDYVGAYEKVHWGHSTVFSWMDLMMGLGVKEMLCGHYDPVTTDAEIEVFYDKALSYAEKVRRGEDIPEIKLAYEGYQKVLGKGSID